MGYWKWLIGGLVKFGLDFLRLVPIVIFKVIPGIFKTGYDFLKEELKDISIWANICAASGTLFLLGFMFYVPLYFMPDLPPNVFRDWHVGILSLFLISTYAYWRSEQ